MLYVRLEENEKGHYNLRGYWPEDSSHHPLQADNVLWKKNTYDDFGASTSLKQQDSASLTLETEEVRKADLNTENNNIFSTNLRRKLFETKNFL